jgi:hypothetical protein
VPLCLGAYGAPGGVGVSYERGTPVGWGLQGTASARRGIELESFYLRILAYLVMYDSG